ncbi:MAG: winged helix DNA-binding domain-containing protein, partial [Clostridia bacterium]|nr:winged helix DNA-binding domain-containing protein [Clostridia bacterium]
MLTLTLRQARRFILLHNGLLGEHRFAGKQGALDFVRQAGCIQFDPVDACGKNAELTLQSRVKGFRRETLYELLYKDRQLADYTDKQLSILPVEDWPYFARYREAARRCGMQFEGLAQLEEQARRYILENGPVDSDTLPIGGEIEWHSAIHWSGNWHGKSNAARSVLEQLYSTGELVIHHKTGTRKTYDLASRHIPQEILSSPDPLPEAFDHLKWRVLRRIGAVGLLFNRPSDAWLGVWDLTTQQRNAVFEQLEAEGTIFPVQVEGIRSPLYCRECDRATLEMAMSDAQMKSRCEAIAPLDPMMWDRKLIRALFG